MQHRRTELYRLPRIGQAQCRRPAHGTGGSVALLDQRQEQPAEVVTQLYTLLLGHGSLLSEGSVPKNTDNRNRCNRLLAAGAALPERAHRAGILCGAGARHHREEQENEEEVYEQIGLLKMELEWLKKNAARFS